MFTRGGELVVLGSQDNGRDALKESQEVAEVRVAFSVTPTRCQDVNDWGIFCSFLCVQFAYATCAKCALSSR